MPEKFLKDISIIIATCNRSPLLLSVLTDLSRLKGCEGIDYEIIVVDNNSKDSTKAVVEIFQQKLPGKIRYLFESRKGKSYALNLGIAQAEGEFLAFTDDDVKVDPYWLKNILECFAKYACDGIGGRVVPYYYPDTPQWLKDNSHRLYGPIVQHDFGEGDRLYDRSQMREFVGANMAFRKSVLVECGGFRIDIGPGQGFIGEDTDLVQRLSLNNKRLYYGSNVLIWHPVEKSRTTLRYLANWFIQIGRFRVRMGTFDKEALVCWGGVPRYLFRALPLDAWHMLINVLDRGKLLKHFILFFIKVGAVREYRMLYKRSRKNQV